MKKEGWRNLSMLRIAFILMVFLLFGLLFIGLSNTGSAMAAEYSNRENYQNTETSQDVLTRINYQRSKEGLKALVLDEKLCEIAEKKAMDMATKRYFSHYSKTYGTVTEMLNFFNYSLPSANTISKAYSSKVKLVTGENIAKGFWSSKTVTDAWINSPGHLSNIMTKAYTHTGIAYVEYCGTTYWVQLFAGPAR